MGSKKWNRMYVFLALFTIVFFVMVLIGCNEKYGMFKFHGDVLFLWNRVLQILNCLKDGNYPFFYYNDFYGVGYGSSIFYGQLTLFPFLPFALCGMGVFVFAYISAIYVLNYIGACILAKRFTGDYFFVGLMYIITPLEFMFLSCTGMMPCNLGVGMGLIFLAFCVDIFRDNKPCYKAVVMFALILNTHMITSLVSFLCCVGICIYYFDKRNIKHYFKFFILSVLSCLYNICNYISHSSSLKGVSELSSCFEYNDVSTVSSLVMVSVFPFRDLFFDDKTNGISIFGLPMLVCWLYVLLRKELSIKERGIHLLAILGLFIGVRQIWAYLVEIFPLFQIFQFPIRYLPYMTVVLLILILRRLDSRKLKNIVMWLSLSSFILTGVCLNFSSERVDAKFFKFVGNGEYLSPNFVYSDFDEYSSNVIGDDGKKYNYSIDKNMLTVDLSSNTSKSITVPKLYYYGYVAESDVGERLSIKEGYSMFAEIDVSGFKGELNVYYRQPLWLVLLMIFDYVFVSCVIVFIIRKRFKKGRGVLT